MNKKFEYPQLWNKWSDMQKFSWIQAEFGEFDDERDIMTGLKVETPEEVKKEYDRLGEALEKYWKNGIDVD